MATPIVRSTQNLHRPLAGPSGRLVVFRQSRCAPGCRALRVVPRAAETGTEAAGGSYGIADMVQRRKDLELEIKLAVKGEDFKTAAKLKQELEQLNQKDPVMAAKMALERAIREERYEEAAKIKSQIKQLEAELGPAALEAGLLTTNSTAVTRGIRVQVQSFFLPTKSTPSAGRYMFAYHVTIVNESTDTIVQLRNRHWVIMDGKGKIEEVRGPGVVGEQPILLPGKSHEYTSGCALPTPQGSMEGEYTMVVLDPEDGQWAETIEDVRKLTGTTACRADRDAATLDRSRSPSHQIGGWNASTAQPSALEKQRQLDAATTSSLAATRRKSPPATYLDPVSRQTAYSETIRSIKASSGADMQELYDRYGAEGGEAMAAILRMPSRETRPRIKTTRADLDAVAALDDFEPGQEKEEEPGEAVPLGPS